MLLYSAVSLAFHRMTSRKAILSEGLGFWQLLAAREAHTAFYIAAKET